MSNEKIAVGPKKLLNVRTILRQGKRVLQALVKWVNFPLEYAAWEDQTFLAAQFQILNLLGDKKVLMGRVLLRIIEKKE